MPLDEIKDMQGAFDVPDTRDFSAIHVLGEPEVGEKFPPAVNLNFVPSHNQGHSMHCTAYGLTHIEEILNSLEHSHQVKLDPEEQWANQAANRGVPATIGGGDSLQNALQTLKKKGLMNADNPEVSVQVFQIDGYAKIEKTLNSYKKWLSAGFPVYTGWKDHCFAIVGYNDQEKVLIAKNSYGPKWGKNGDGTFTVEYNEMNQLFSGYIVYDHRDLQMIFKDVSEEMEKLQENYEIKEMTK